MKISRKDTGFRPVVITLETREEVKEFRAGLANTPTVNTVCFNIRQGLFDADADHCDPAGET